MPAVSRKRKPPPYESVEDYLREAARRWAYLRRYDFDDLFSLANEVYLDVCGKWAGGGSPHAFDKTLRYYLWAAFSMRLRDHRRRKGLAKIEDGYEPDCVGVTESPFSLALFVDGMPADAAGVVRLIFDSPPAFLKALRAGGWKPADCGRNRAWAGNPYRGYAGAIKAYLMKSGKWTERRADEAFQVIRGALA